MNRGLFERDKMMFKLMVTMKIMVVNNQLTNGDLGLFLKGENYTRNEWRRRENYTRNEWRRRKKLHSKRVE